MKKLSLITLALLTLLLAQCKKEKIDNNSGTDVKKVKVRCEVPMGNGEKTDFSNLMEGKIKWSTGTERIYLVINGENHQIIELTATTTVPGATLLFFEGEVPENVIGTIETYDIWYFGNSLNLGENSYVQKTESDGVITQIDGSISTQSGNLSDLGYYHIAKGSAYFETTDEEVTLKITNDGKLQNQIAIAYMDLTNVSKLIGSAIVGNSYSLQYNEGSGQYEFVVSEVNKVINIADNTNPTESFVVLLPNDVANVEIISNNDYRYVFKNGIEKNNIYHSSSNDNNIVTLSWEYYPNSNGHEYVDLGLSVKWAKYNIGVNPAQLTNAADYYGDHFVWGNTQDVYNDRNLHCNMDDIQDTDNDAAKVNWGGSWVMPNKTQMEELLDKCTWTKVNEFEGVTVNGWIATSTINGESIFFPGAGYCEVNSVSTDFEDNKKIYYWTSTDAEDYLNKDAATVLKQNPHNVEQIQVTRDEAEDARSIRPVLKPIN